MKGFGIRDVAGRAAIAVMVIGVSAVGLAGPATAVNMDQYIEVPQCQPATSQLCPQVPTVSFGTNHERSILVEFTANQNHCSDIIAHIFIDGAEWGSNRVGPGKKDGGYEIPVSRGRHVLGVQAEGVAGGCNTGVLNSWGGTVHIHSLQDPNKGTSIPPR